MIIFHDKPKERVDFRKPTETNQSRKSRSSRVFRMVLKGLLIHVGADSTNLGISGPIFGNGSFEYIPLGPEYKDSSERLTYNDLGLSRFIPLEFDNLTPHYDPNPRHFTYGEPPNKQRGKQLLKLRPGDYLFPVASLAPVQEQTYSTRVKSAIRASQHGRMAKYVIGWYAINGIFRVDKTRNVYRVTAAVGNDSVPHGIREQVHQNAHFKRASDTFVCATGVKDGRNTCLLKRAIQLTEAGAPFKPNKFGVSLYGDRTFPRGFKWLQEDRVRILLSEIERQRFA